MTRSGLSKPASYSLPAQLVADRLAAEAGMDARVLDVARLEWIIENRRAHLRLPTTLAYAQHLHDAPAEVERLIEDAVVRETSFFRDAVVFEQLRASLPKLAASFPGPLRLLSAPCGAGQEVYSLAATVEEAGIPLSRVWIDAFDISTTALDIAKKGIYSAQTLRQISTEHKRSLGTTEGSHLKIHTKLRDCVHFERRNLTAPDALAAEPGYHVILCRNLFIYLHAEAREVLANSLAGGLVPGGRLVLGAADRVREVSEFFVSMRPANSFAFAHRMTLADAVPSAQAKQRRLGLSASLPKAISARVAKKNNRSPNSLVTNEVAVTASELYNRALEQKRQGTLGRAERLCRQALYLEPHSLSALELLQQLWVQQPNLRLGRALDARIRRTRSAQSKNEVA